MGRQQDRRALAHRHYDAGGDARISRVAVVAHLQEHQACPSNDDAGFGPPASYASGQIDSITVGEFDTSLCGLELRLTVPGNDKLDGKAVWFEYDPAGNSWQCSSEIEDKYLPTHCRE